MADDDAAEQVGIDDIGRRRGQGRGPQQGIGRLQRLGADMLDAALVERVCGRDGGVILFRAADEGEVDSLNAARLRNGEVGAVGHGLIDEDRQRVGRDAARGAGTRAGEQGDGFGIAAPGLEHHGPATAAARLQIDHRPDAVAQGMATPEGAGTVEVQLLAVGQDDDQGPVGRPSGADGPDSLEDGGEAGAVVRCPG